MVWKRTAGRTQVLPCANGRQLNKFRHIIPFKPNFRFTELVKNIHFTQGCSICGRLGQMLQKAKSTMLDLDIDWRIKKSCEFCNQRKRWSNEGNAMRLCKQAR